MPSVTVNGIEIDYSLYGDPASPPLLLVMGLGMPAALWPDSLLQELVAQGFRVICFDNRDCGGSTRLAGLRGGSVPVAIARALLRWKVRAPYNLDDMAADTVGLLDALGIGRAHVVGASMGGMIAQVVAARYPHRVLSLTSIMSSTGNPQRRIAFGKRRALAALLKPPPPPEDYPAVAAHLLRVFGVIGSPGIPQDREALRAHFERVARRGLYRSGTERQMLAILASGDRRELLGRITAPTLVLHGSADPLVPLAAGLDTADHIPGARMEVVMGMGHDFPDVLMPRLARRVAEHCRAAANPAVAAA
jgi:pimeloyl-ACP methyl ester carboxylesterase